MDVSFEEQLAELDKGSSLHREMMFQQLRNRIPGNEKSLLQYLAIHPNAKGKAHVLALIAGTGLPEVLPVLENHLDDPNPEVQSWAKYGLEHITGKPVVITKDKVLLALVPIRKRLFWYTLLEGLLVTIIFFTLALILGFPFSSKQYSLSYAESVGLYTILTGIITWLSLGNASDYRTIRAYEDRVEGLTPALIFSQRGVILRKQIDIAKTKQARWLQRIDNRWHIVSANGLQLAVVEYLYPQPQVEALKK